MVPDRDPARAARASEFLCALVHCHTNQPKSIKLRVENSSVTSIGRVKGFFGAKSIERINNPELGSGLIAGQSVDSGNKSKALQRTTRAREC
jgi:hypothetical protein